MPVASTAAMEIILRARDDSQKALSQVEGNLGRVRSALGTVTKAAAGLAIGAAGGLAAFGAMAVKTAGEFESEMAIMSVAAREAGASVDELREFALQMGADTFFSAGEAAEAMTNLFKAGLSWEEVQERMVPITDLASASSLGLAQAADAVNVAMATFGEQAGTAEQIVNSFVGTADASVAEVEDLTAALVNVGPTAASFGWAMEDVNTALAILSERGIVGAEAGTALKSMMTNLMRPTDDVTGALEYLGISLFNAEGNMKSLDVIIADLDKSMAGLTEQQRLQIIQTLAGTYGMKAMNTLLAEGVIGWEEMEAAIGEAASAHDVATARMDTFAGSMEALKGSIETLLIRAGLPLIENFARPLVDFINNEIMPAFDVWAKESLPLIIDRVMEFGSSALQWITETALPAFQGFIESIDWAAIASFLSDATTKIQEFGATAKEWIEGNTTPILAGLAAMLLVTVVPAFVAWSAAAIAAAVATVAALAPVVLPIAAIGAAVALLVAAWENDWGGIRTTLTEVWEEHLQPAFEAIGEWLEVNIPVAIETLSDFWTDTLQPAMEDVWAFIQDYLIPLFEALAEVAKVTLSLAIEALAGLWQNVLEPALRSVWAFVQDNVIPILKSLAGTVGDTVGPKLEGLKGLLDKAKGAFDAVKSAIESVTKWLGTLADKIGSIKLPGWLTPGSVTPFEEGLRGIADVMHEVAGAAGVMMAGLEVGMEPSRFPSLEDLDQFMRDFAVWLNEIERYIYGLTEELHITEGDVERMTAWGQMMSALGGGIQSAVQGLLDLALYQSSAELADQAFRFRLDMMEVLEQFKIMADEYGLEAEGLDALIEITRDIGRALDSAVDGLLGLGAYTGVQDFEVAVDRFVGDLTSTLRALGAAAASLGDLGIPEAWSEAIGALMGGLAEALELLIELKTYISPVRERIREFCNDVEFILESFGDWATHLRPEFKVLIVEPWVETIETLMSGLGEGLGLLSGLIEYKSPTRDSIMDFCNDVELILESFGDWAVHLRPEWQAGIIEPWANLLEVLTSGLENGLDLLSGLIEYISPTRDFIMDFCNDVEFILESFGDWVVHLRPEWQAGIIGPWAEVIGNLMSGLAAGLELLEGLVWYVSPVEQHIEDFMEDVGSVLATFLSWATGELATLADESMLAFAGAVGEIFSGVEEAVGALTGIVDFAEGEQEGSFAYALGAFNEAVIMALESWQTWMVGEFEPQALAATTAFWQACKDIWGAIGEAVSALAGIADFEGMPLEVFTSFGEAVRAALTVLSELSLEFSIDSISAANEFLAAAMEILGTLRAAFDNLSILAAWAEEAEESMERFGAQVLYMLGELAQAAMLMGYGIEHAVSFHSSASRILEEILAALADMRAAETAWKTALEIAARVAQVPQAPNLTAMPSPRMVGAAAGGGSVSTTNLNIAVSGQTHIDRQQAQEIARALGRELRLQGVRA